MVLQYRVSVTIESERGMDRNAAFVVKDCYMELISAVTRSSTAP